MIIIDIRRRWDPCVAQIGLILPGGGEYNGFLIGDYNNRYNIGRRWDPHVAPTGFILPGGRKCGPTVLIFIM